MTLPPGFRLGTYEVLGSLGAGGMGEVFRARDSRLGRDVALKVLSGPLRDDAERLARFEREARVLASLNHPNIATLHAIEELGEARSPVLILELIDGETLAERIARGPLPPHEAVAVAGQIAAALDAAHRARRRPPGPEARQHQAARRRHGESARLRDRTSALRQHG